jgi:hypothetical protein
MLLPVIRTAYELLGRVDESAALDELPGLKINYDPAWAPEAGTEVVEGHWHIDSGATLIGREGPGPPEPGGAWELACRLVSRYEFADARILRGVYAGSGWSERCALGAGLGGRLTRLRLGQMRGER